MVKTLRVSEETYQYVMAIVGDLQSKEKKKVSVDTALKEFISHQKTGFKKDPKAWEKWRSLRFHGGKDPDCLDLDSAE